MLLNLKDATHRVAVAAIVVIGRIHIAAILVHVVRVSRIVDSARPPVRVRTAVPEGAIVEVAGVGILAPTAANKIQGVLQI